MPSQARDPGGLDNQAVPLGVELAGDVESLDQTGFMTAVTLGINALEARDRRLLSGDGLERDKQGWLVGLDLGKQSVAAVASCFKVFLTM